MKRPLTVTPLKRVHQCARGSPRQRDPIRVDQQATDRLCPTVTARKWPRTACDRLHRNQGGGGQTKRWMTGLCHITRALVHPRTSRKGDALEWLPLGVIINRRRITLTQLQHLCEEGRSGALARCPPPSPPAPAHAHASDVRRSQSSACLGWCVW